MKRIIWHIVRLWKQKLEQYTERTRTNDSGGRITENLRRFVSGYRKCCSRCQQRGIFKAQQLYACGNVRSFILLLKAFDELSDSYCNIIWMDTIVYKGTLIARFSSEHFIILCGAINLTRCFERNIIISLFCAGNGKYFQENWPSSQINEPISANRLIVLQLYWTYQLPNIGNNETATSTTKRLTFIRFWLAWMISIRCAQEYTAYNAHNINHSTASM